MSKEEFNEITDAMVAKTIFCTKAVLTSTEAAAYMGVSKSYLYKLTMKGEIPHYKPKVRCAILTVKSWKNGCKVIDVPQMPRLATEQINIV